MSTRSLVLLSLLTCASLACKGKDDPDKAHDTDDTDDTGDSDEVQRFTLLHTNDWQSHMLGFGPNAEYTPDSTGDDGTVGGLARTKTLVDEIRAASTDPVVLFDGGDWMAGDLFQLLATTHAAELQMMQALEYDAIILGNHEFDWGPNVLGDMISLARSEGVTVPILAANTELSSDSGDDALEALFDAGEITPTLVLTLDNGLTLGLVGLLGDEAATITPGVSPASFSDMIPAAQDEVAALQAQGVDVVIAITHAGVTDDASTSPDHLLAEAVPAIDVIVGGHSHTPLPEPMTSGDTVILQAGAYTQYLGQLDLAWDGETLTVEQYQLHELDDSIAGDPEITEMIDGFRAALDAGPLQEIGYAFDETIASIPGDLAVEECTESGLGNFITDAYRLRMNELIGPDGDLIDAAFESQGVIRDNLLQGSTGVQGFSDIFRVLPLGFGTDDLPGYALVDFYVTAAELKDVCEVTASISPSNGCNYFVEVSGIRCNVDMERSQFNRAQSVDLWDGDAWVALDNSDEDTLYHVAVDSYVASLMGILEGLTYGSIIITAKDADGNVTSAPEDMVFDADPDTAGVQELKLWQALLDYAASYEDTDGDGVPDVDDRYLGPEGRFTGLE